MKYKHIIVILTIAATFSCRPVSSERVGAKSESAPQGQADKGLSSKLFPPFPKKADTLTKIGKSLAHLGDDSWSMRSPIGQFRGKLFAIIIRAGGLPREQIKRILEHACGGSMVFDIDKQLDEALADVKKSSQLAQPDMAAKRSLLIRSLERHPGWLTPSDFGDPLTPRKAYDLTAEIDTFKSCPSCSISADEGTIKSMIAGARQGDHFVWALRPDGRLVVGRGPDEKMSHGVLASIDIVDIALTKRETLPVLASGEGYIDPVQKTLVLNNKSGHYRPEFKRVHNTSIKRLFGALLPDTASNIRFVDQTKPR